jgi:TIGR02687 family protein
MAELNLKQITDKLNNEFASDVRRLVFWYDVNAEFQDDIDNLELINAKVLHLEADNQFYIKYFLEREDTKTNYLIYAPFAKPPIENNHLADTIRYSKEFFADLSSLIIIDLGIDERYKPVVKKYIKFFANKERMQKFYDLEFEIFNKNIIEIAIMSVICKSKTVSFEEVLRTVLTADKLEENKYLAEFEKYELTTAFWEQVDVLFGYNESKSTLEKLLITMFITYLSKSIKIDIPKSWQPLVSYKSGSIIAFMDNLMNNYIYSSNFDEISEYIYNTIDAKNQLNQIEIEALVDCDIFAGIDKILIDWIIQRLESEDVGAKLNGKTIAEICIERRKSHFGKDFLNDYFILQNAYNFISKSKYEPISDINRLIEEYTNSIYKVDTYYRYFYFYYDMVEDTTKFERIRELVENIYTNEYLNKITVNWNNEFAISDNETKLTKQRNFFTQYIKYSKNRVAVIISDALRYEVAYTLFEKLQSDEKCSATISAMEGVLPSYTALGMASLLPHKKIEYSLDYNVLIDGKECATTKQREIILKEYKKNSNCVQFDIVKNMKKTELRSIFTGQDVVYIYHNQIDARGDKSSSENEVFTACEEAINEIYLLIKKIASQANTVHFIVTADHGFIYKRDRIEANEKIEGVSSMTNTIGQRYALSSNEIKIGGVCHTTVGKILGNRDSRIISFPLGSDIFKVAGAGQNYVHGGCSPQEMLVPLIEVKVDKGKVETYLAKIALVSLTTKITNLITTMDFVQTEPVSDVVKEASYRVYFVSENNEKISNENIVIADKKDNDSTKRMFRLRFNFKNKQYNKSQKYYLVAYENKNDMEVFRHEIIMDIAFADDFGFFG